MIYALSDDAGKEILTLKGEQYKYLIKVRRHSVGDELFFRNKEQIKQLHRYIITDIESRSATLKLLETNTQEFKPKKFFHIGWCVIDSKSVEKVLASLNEMGVGKVSFVYCERSQKNFKPDIKRYQRILEASNQQCGRTDFIEFEIFKNLSSFIDAYPDTQVLDFTPEVLEKESDLLRVLIGCEGGFSPSEKELLQNQKRFRFDTPLVLRSESAALAISAKVLL